MILAIALIAAALILIPVGIWAAVVLDRRATGPDETDWIAPHADWIEQQELDRLVNAIVLDAHRAYDEYRGEVR